MRIAFVYLFLFGAVGVALPYLPPYLKALGLTGTEVGIVGGLPALVQIGVPMVWGFAADRTRRPVRLLQVAAFGAALAFAPLLLARSFLPVVLIIGCYAIFSSTLSPLADSVAVVEARRAGTPYARLRLWGSVGFIVTTFAFGLWVAGPGRGADVVPWALVLLGLTAVATLFVRPGAPPPTVPTLADVRRLAARPGLALFLVACLLHWAALGPFHVLFAIHLHDVGVGSRAVGAGLALAVGAEVVVMRFFHRLEARIPLFGILAVAFLASALRWVLTARLHDAAPLVLVQLVHGLSFGAFFVAAIHHLERTVPEGLRATGRALFGAVAFGVGGVLGSVLAGRLYDLGGGRLAFDAAALLDLAAPILLVASALVERRPVDGSRAPV